MTLSSGGITKPGDWHFIKGEGMPVYQSTAHGDLWVQYTVAFPDQVSLYAGLACPHFLLWIVLGEL